MVTLFIAHLPYRICRITICFAQMPSIFVQPDHLLFLPGHSISSQCLFFITRSYNIFIFLRTRMSLFFIGLIAPRDLRPQRRIQRRRTWRALPSCRTVALRSSKVGMGDRKATVPYMQKTFYLRRRFFVARYECFISASVNIFTLSAQNVRLIKYKTYLFT